VKIEFKKWMKLLPEETLYHGTRSTFDQIEPRKSRFGTGVSYTTNPEIAQNYALGKYKGSKTVGDPIVKKTEYQGRSFNFNDPVLRDVAIFVFDQLKPYLNEFTADKYKLFARNIQTTWRSSGENFYREIQRSFAKQGTDGECKLAKSRNVNRDVCNQCAAFGEMPDLLNKIISDFGYDALCYDDTNDGVSHRCYFFMSKKNR
jgi:hypothetical protein